MLRPIEFIISAFLAIYPNMEDGKVKAYAKHLQKLAVDHSFDPVTTVSMGVGESDWNPQAINVVGDEQYIGIFQIRLRNYRSCRHGLESADCQHTRSVLQDWRFNATQAARAITVSRKFCRELIGSAKFGEWLFSFQGYNGRRWNGRRWALGRGGTYKRPKRGEVWCGHMWDGRRWKRARRPKTVQAVMNRRIRIIRIVEEQEAAHRRRLRKK